MTSFKKLRAANQARDAEWDPDGKIDLGFRAAELGGEVGELLNCIKKLIREQIGIRGSRATMEEVADELADVAICTDLLAMHLGVDLDASVARKFNKTSEKYGLSVMI